MTDELIGKIVEGDVVSVKEFGAFVRLENGDNGLIHISEITHDYVKNINDYIKEGQRVRIKILGKKDQNKYTLSLKQALEKPADKTLFIRTKSKNEGFEDKISMFLKKSEEKLIDIRRNLKSKQGITKRRK